MSWKTPLVWKVNGLILLVLVSVLGGLTFATNEMFEREALASNRIVSKANSGTILEGIRGLMMTRDTAEMEILFDRLVSDTALYRDVRLISHRGQIVASTEESGSSTLDLEAWPCNACHGRAGAAAGLSVGSFDEVFEVGEGGRVLSIVTPIYREGSCGTGGCHSDPASPPLLGLLQTDYSLARVDGLIAQRFFHAAFALVVSVLLCTGVFWWMMDRFVGRRIKALREGAERVAQKDLTFRFGDTRRDGIGQLSSTFDETLGQLSGTLTELAKTREYLQGIVENSADVIITVDPSGLIRTFNTGAENVLGYEREEVVGQRIEMLFSDPRERDLAIARLSHTDNVANYETHFLTKSGEIKDVILTLSRLRTPDGEAIGTFGISKDVTKEKKLQKALILKERLAAVGEAVASIHHTLKNLLGSLKGGSYMVNVGLEENDPAVLRRGWAMVEEGIAQVTDLSSRMLQYVREWDPDIEEIPPDDLLASVLRAGVDTACRKGIQLRMSVTPGLPPLRCDPRLIHSAVTDLMVNALEACEWKEFGAEEGPEVVLSAYPDHARQRLVIAVSDNGQGIREEFRCTIFDPFFTTKKSVGTGLGLTLASRIVRMHGGTIDLESKPGCGSTFRILLPVGAPHEWKEQHDAREDPGH